MSAKTKKLIIAASVLLVAIIVALGIFLLNGETKAKKISVSEAESLVNKEFDKIVCVAKTVKDKIDETAGIVFTNFNNRNYVTIPKLLNEKGYYTFSMHANNADFWNRRTMHNSLGYQRFFSKTDYEVEKENVIGLGLSDKEFFRQSIEKIEKINNEKEKWYGLLIMLSNHTPFSETEKYGEFPVDIKETITKEEIDELVSTGKLTDKKETTSEATDVEEKPKRTRKIKKNDTKETK